MYKILINGKAPLFFSGLKHKPFEFFEEAKVFINKWIDKNVNKAYSKPKWSKNKVDYNVYGIFDVDKEIIEIVKIEDSTNVNDTYFLYQILINGKVLVDEKLGKNSFNNFVLAHEAAINRFSRPYIRFPFGWAGEPFSFFFDEDGKQKTIEIVRLAICVNKKIAENVKVNFINC